MSDTTRMAAQLNGTDMNPDEVPELIELARAGLCNDSGGAFRQRMETERRPTEGSMITLAAKCGLDPAFQKEEVAAHGYHPLSPNTASWQALHHHDHAGHGFIYVKARPNAYWRCATGSG